MKAEKATNGIIKLVNGVVQFIREQFSFEFHALPQHYTRMVEKFDVIENYKIRDGF